MKAASHGTEERRGFNLAGGGAGADSALGETSGEAALNDPGRGPAPAEITSQLPA